MGRPVTPSAALQPPQHAGMEDAGACAPGMRAADRAVSRVAWRLAKP